MNSVCVCLEIVCKTVSLPIDKVVHHIVPVCYGVYQSNQMQITVTEKDAALNQEDSETSPDKVVHCVVPLICCVTFA